MNQGSVYKTLLVGDQGVGKSSLLYQITKNEFKNEYASTVGLEFGSKSVTLSNGSNVVLQIWDTAGQETFKSIIRSFYRNAAAVFILYQINRRESFDNIDEWIAEARENSHQDVIIVLVASKADLNIQREVSMDEGRQKQQKTKADLFFEISSKNRWQIDEMFRDTIKLIEQRLQSERFQTSLVDIEQQQEVRQSSRNESLLNKTQEVQKKDRCC